MALLHKHLQLLLPHATDIYSRSVTLLRESPCNGSVGEKLRGMCNFRCMMFGGDGNAQNSIMYSLFYYYTFLIYVFPIFVTYVTDFLIHLCTWLHIFYIFFYLYTDVIYVSAAGSMLCQLINALLLLPVSVSRPLLSYLLDLLPPLDRLNRLLPAAALLEDQELQWPLHGKRGGAEGSY